MLIYWSSGIRKDFEGSICNANENKVPPWIHNLVKLAELSSLELTEEQKLFLDEINDFNLEARYPDHKLEFYKRCTKKYTDEYFKKIEEFHKWLKSQLK